jgi:hypothetical protein
MSQATLLPNRVKHRRHNHEAHRPRPALIGIRAAADYLSIARSTFYARFLPGLETVRIGKRRMVVTESLDELIEKLRGRDAGE